MGSISEIFKNSTSGKDSSIRRLDENSPNLDTLAQPLQCNGVLLGIKTLTETTTKKNSRPKK
jgi:hypothetical protein